MTAVTAVNSFLLCAKFEVLLSISGLTAVRLPKKKARYIMNQAPNVLDWLEKNAGENLGVKIGS